jgi:quercetin dioxygenase-like cupin family protein
MITGQTYIDRSDTMYPSIANLFDINEIGDQGYFYTKEYSTIYGYVIEGDVNFPNGKVATQGDYFCYWSHDAEELFYVGKVAVFTRIGYRGQNIIGGPLEERGRLSYIDGCSDSLLIYPSRLGDPSLNMLHFPKGTEQSYHTHPSIRFGIVVRGTGYATINPWKNDDGDIIETNIQLETGAIFCIEQQEKHRFVTTGQEMVVLAYHPDGDWSPTDHNHTMLNRTYLTK